MKALPTLSPAMKYVGFAAILAVMAALAWAGLHALADARRDLQTVKVRIEIAAHPIAQLMASDFAQQAGDGDAAKSAIESRLRKEAGSRGLLMERLAAKSMAANPSVLATELSISGAEADILDFVRAIEAGRPAMRFERWKISRTGPDETAIRLDARAISYWEAR